MGILQCFKINLICITKNFLKFRIESSGAVHSIIFKLTSSGCSDESTLKEPVEKQIQTGLLGSSLKVCATDLHFQKLTETGNTIS